MILAETIQGSLLSVRSVPAETTDAERIVAEQSANAKRSVTNMAVTWRWPRNAMRHVSDERPFALSIRVCMQQTRLTGLSEGFQHGADRLRRARWRQRKLSTTNMIFCLAPLVTLSFEVAAVV